MVPLYQRFMEAKAVVRVAVPADTPAAEIFLPFPLTVIVFAPAWPVASTTVMYRPVAGDAGNVIDMTPAVGSQDTIRSVARSVYGVAAWLTAVTVFVIPPLSTKLPPMFVTCVAPVPVPMLVVPACVAPLLLKIFTAFVPPVFAPAKRLKVFVPEAIAPLNTLAVSVAPLMAPLNKANVWDPVVLAPPSTAMDCVPADATPDIIVKVWLAPGVAPLKILTDEAPVADAPVAIFIVCVDVLTPVPRLTVFPPVPVERFKVFTPFPMPMDTVFVAELFPTVIKPVWAAAPKVIVAPTAPCKFIAVAALIATVPDELLPIFMFVAVASAAIFTVPPLPTIANVEPDACVKVIFPALAEPKFNTWAAAPVPMFTVPAVVAAVEPKILATSVPPLAFPLNRLNVQVPEAITPLNKLIVSVAPAIAPLNTWKFCEPVELAPPRNWHDCVPAEATPAMTASVWLAAGVAPFKTLTTHACELEAALFMDTVFVPEPFAMRTEEIPVELPKTIFPVCAVPPIVIVPDVVLGPIAYVEAPSPSNENPLDPTAIVMPLVELATPIVIVLTDVAPAPIFMVFIPFPLAIEVEFVPVPPLSATVFPPFPWAMLTVDAPAPPPTTTVWLPDDDPSVIIPVPLDFPIVIVVVVAPVIETLPVPACKVKLAAPVWLPIVTRFAAASLAMPTVLPPPVSEKFPAPTATVIAPEEPPIVVAAVPDAFKLTVPTAVKAVEVTAAGVVLPKANGTAKIAAALEGVSTVFVDIAPA